MSVNKPLTNYNIFHLQGDNEVDDMDVVETLGLDPQVAYTPAINDAAIEKQRKENIDGYIKRGVPEGEARDLADTLARAAKASVEAAMRDQRKDFQM